LGSVSFAKGEEKRGRQEETSELKLAKVREE
jgi:hypothetical protein